MIWVPIDAEFHGGSDGALQKPNRLFPERIQRRKAGPFCRSLDAGFGAHHTKVWAAAGAVLGGTSSGTPVVLPMVHLPSKWAGLIRWPLSVPSKDLPKLVARSQTRDSTARHVQRRKVGPDSIPPRGSRVCALHLGATLEAFKRKALVAAPGQTVVPGGIGVAWKKRFKRV